MFPFLRVVYTNTYFGYRSSAGREADREETEAGNAAPYSR